MPLRLDLEGWWHRSRSLNLHGHSFMVKINAEMLESALSWPPFEDAPPVGVLLRDYNNTDSFDYYYAMQYSSTYYCPLQRSQD